MSTIKRCRPLLGTFVEITLSEPRMPEHALEDLADLAFGRIARVQSLMSSRDPSSELARLNACGHLHPLPVNEWTREVLAETLRLSRISDGVFTVAASQPELASARDIILHRDGRVSFKKPMTLDLGAVARGFAVDKAAELLAEQGAFQATINAGGDMRFIGALPKVVPVGLPSPTAATAAARLHADVTGPAMATSAAHSANRRHHWRKTSDILHPRTRRPMRSNVTVSVFAQSCVQAEALSSVVLLDDPQSWQTLLVKERASAVFVTAKGELVRFPAAA